MRCDHGFPHEREMKRHPSPTLKCIELPPLPPPRPKIDRPRLNEKDLSPAERNKNCADASRNEDQGRQSYFLFPALFLSSFLELFFLALLIESFPKNSFLCCLQQGLCISRSYPCIVCVTNENRPCPLFWSQKVHLLLF
jgi:hypothetical protein